MGVVRKGPEGDVVDQVAQYSSLSKSGADYTPFYSPPRPLAGKPNLLRAPSACVEQKKVLDPFLLIKDGLTSPLP